MADVTFAVDFSTDAAPILLQSTTKSSVIDQDLSQHGMGRYQWLIWAICSTGLSLDVMWGQAFGYASPSIQRELGFSDKEFGNITAAFAAGVTAGAFIWGALVDVVGRRVAFLGTSLIAGAFGMCLGAQSSYSGLLVFIAFTGFGVGGNVPIDSTITMEYLPEDRFYLLTALSISRPIGAVISSLVAFGLVPNYSCSTNLVSCQMTEGVTPCCSKDANMGWRYLFFTIGSITLGVFVIRFFVIPFYESPKFLLSKGDDRGAVEIVRKIAAFNRRPCDLTMESLYERCKEPPAVAEMDFSKRFFRELSRLRLLFGNRRVLRVAIHIWSIWMLATMGNYITMAYLPTILQRKNGAINVGLEQTYVDYLIIFTPGIVGVVLSILFVRAPMVGRKWTLVGSAMVTGISLFLFHIVNTHASYVGINVLQNFFLNLFVAACYGWTPEAFPTAVRGTATGLAAFFGSLLGICGPLIAAQLFNNTNGSDGVLYLAGACFFVCSISMLCFPARDMVAPR